MGSTLSFCGIISLQTGAAILSVLFFVSSFDYILLLYCNVNCNYYCMHVLTFVIWSLIILEYGFACADFICYYTILFISLHLKQKYKFVLESLKLFMFLCK